MTAHPASVPPEPPPSPLPGALAGHEVLVIGGSSGIGLATAHLLDSVGAAVVLAARDPGRLAAAAAGFSRPPRTETVDVTDAGDVNRLLRSVGRVDHVVVTAATVATGALADTPLPPEEVNLRSRLAGGYHVARAAAPLLVPAGSLVLTSGVFAYRPAPGTALAAASLGAVEALTRALAVELAPIRVNVIRPGNTDTPLFRGFLGGADDAAVAHFGARLPLGRVGRAEEVAAAVLFCLANPYVTGSVVVVDGGVSLR